MSPTTFRLARPLRALVAVICLAICAAVFSAITPGTPAQSQEDDEPQPRRPEDAIVAALQDHDVVVIGESHQLAEAGALYRRIVRDESLRRVVDDFVVEFGNARYQDTVDRYVSGMRVKPAQLRRVWRDTTQVGSWDSPMYEAFFKAVRRGNRETPRSEDIRILLGDPPIDWDKVTTFKAWQRFALRREPYMAGVIKRHVLDRRRKAVVITGILHARRGESELMKRLEQWRPEGIYVVVTHLGFPKMEWERKLYDWPAPSIAALAGTWIGDLPRHDGTASDTYDALLYLGNTSFLRMSIPLPTLYRDDDYWRTLRHRFELAFRQRFDPDMFFGYVNSIRYPESGVDEVELSNIYKLSECMRAEGVEAFPDPEAGFDFLGWEDGDLEVARADEDFEEANQTCPELYDFPPFM